MAESSSSMKPLEMKWEEERAASYSIQMCSNPTRKVSSILTVLGTIAEMGQTRSIVKSATNSIPRTVVEGPTAGINTSADYVNERDMAKPPVPCRSPQQRVPRPKYLWYNKWDVEGRPVLGVAKWSEEADLLPAAPILEQDHPVSIMVESCPDLFKIITPINAELFHCSLLTHPNESFVESVCQGLDKGFWP